jgi:hypothetical protein
MTASSRTASDIWRFAGGWFKVSIGAIVHR